MSGSKPTDEEWAIFKRRFPLVASLAEKLEEKGMKIVWNGPDPRKNND